jgi:hypothetical protein
MVFETARTIVKAKIEDFVEVLAYSVKLID